MPVVEEPNPKSIKSRLLQGKVGTQPMQPFFNGRTIHLENIRHQNRIQQPMMKRMVRTMGAPVHASRQASWNAVLPSTMRSSSLPSPRYFDHRRLLFPDAPRPRYAFCGDTICKDDIPVHSMPLDCATKHPYSTAAVSFGGNPTVNNRVTNHAFWKHPRMKNDAFLCA